MIAADNRVATIPPIVIFNYDMPTSNRQRRHRTILIDHIGIIIVAMDDPRMGLMGDMGLRLFLRKRLFLLQILVGSGWRDGLGLRSNLGRGGNRFGRSGRWLGGLNRQLNGLLHICGNCCLYGLFGGRRLRRCLSG